MARHLTDFLKGTDRFGKTLIFCVDQEHASEMRQELVNLNSDLVKQYPDYVCRVTADEGAIGLTHLSHFQDVDKPALCVVIVPPGTDETLRPRRDEWPGASGRCSTTTAPMPKEARR
jgi:hypothetical protein